MSTSCNERFDTPLLELTADSTDRFKVFVSCASTTATITSETGLSSNQDDFARLEFNRKRTLIIRNTPSVTYAEVKAYMGRFAIADISISKRQQHAIVTLKNGGEAEAAVSELSGNHLAGSKVEISLYRADNLLYVTGLPADVIKDDHEFRSFVESYGPIEKCFLMKASNGLSKGYGIVEFAHNKEKSEQARCEINGIKLGLDSSVICCGFISDSVKSFEDLHSRCLVVSRFPRNLSDNELRTVFSRVALPAHCEVAHSDNKGNRLALVEFRTSSDAERTVLELKASKPTWRVEYCAPGETSAQILRLIRIPVSESQSKHAVDVCPAVVNLIENNPQVLEYFRGLLHQLHENIPCQQNASGTYGCGYASQTDRLLLTNPSFQVALLGVLFAGQQHKRQATFFTGRMRFSTPNQAYHIVKALTTIQLMPVPISHPTKAGCHWTVTHSATHMGLSSSSFVVKDQPLEHHWYSKSFIFTGGAKTALPGVGEPLMLQAAAMIEKHCSSVNDVVHNARSLPNPLNNQLLNPVSMLQFNSSLLLELPVPPFVTGSNKGPLVLPFSKPVHPPPTACVPQMSFPPLICTIPPPDTIVPFTAVPPPSLHPSVLRPNSVVPLDTAKMLASSHPPPPVHQMMEPYSAPNLASKLAMPQSTSLPLNVLPLPNSAPPQSNIGSHRSAFNAVTPQNLSVPVLLPNTVLPIVNVPPPPTPHTVLSDIQYLTTPLGSVHPPCSQSLPIAVLSSDWFAPRDAVTLHPPASAVLAPVQSVSRALVPRGPMALPRCDDVPRSAVAATSPTSKRKVLRAIVGRHTQDQALKNATGQRSRENNPSSAAFTETLPMYGASARPNVSRILTDSTTNIEKPAVVSVIGQKRPRRAPTVDAPLQLPVTPVADHTMKSNFIQSPEPSPDSGYVGQHSQGIGGHYADSYFTKRRKVND